MTGSTNLADEKLDSITSDTPVTGIKWFKNNKTIVVNINYDLTSNGTWVNVATLPYKPAESIFGVAKENLVDYYANIQVASDGKLYLAGTGTGTHRVRGSVTFFIA